MKISLNWLEEVLGTKLTVSPNDLSEILLHLGFEVSSLTRFPKCSGIVASRILEISKHPNADRLKIAKVTDGRETNSVVCGAPNIEVGQTVFWARVGAQLSNGDEVRESVIRGVKSPGMLCSLRELGIGDEHDGIWVLDEKEAALGAQISDLAECEDSLFDVEVTPNRPDCLSVHGITREIAAILNLKMTDFYRAAGNGASLPFYPVQVEDPSDCPRYIAKKFENISIKKSSPKIETRLIRCGFRPINNVVDTTNYVLNESGQPLHTFDADKLEGGKIIVRRAGKNESLRALDGKTYQLSPDILVIADAKKPVAVAGVMGGEKSAVNADTKNILLESAVFDRGLVRHARKKLNLASESSYRFERGVSDWSCEAGSDRAQGILQQTAQGRMTSFSNVSGTSKPTPSVTVRNSQVEKMLGEKILPQETAHIFQRLGIPLVSSDDSRFVVQSPKWRLDLNLEIDYIEEIARLRGYEKIPSHGTGVRITDSFGVSRSIAVNRKIRRSMISLGFNESVNYGLISKPTLHSLVPEKNLVEIENPLSEDQSVLRPALAFELLKNLKQNLAYQKKDIRLFEIGTVFQKVNGQPREKERLAAVAVGKTQEETWQIKKAMPIDFFWIKGIVEELLEVHSRGRVETEFIKSTDAGEGAFLFPDLKNLFHPAYSFRIRNKSAGQKHVIGYVGLLYPGMIKELDREKAVVIFELDREVFDRTEFNSRYRKISLFPSIQRDCSIWVRNELLWGDLLAQIRSSGGAILKDCTLFDIYYDKKRPGFKSLSFTLTFQHPEKTLEDETANQVRDKVIRDLRKKFDIEQRKE